MKLIDIFNESLNESIDVSNLKKIGDITEFTVKPWRDTPGDFTSACQAAGFYARKYEQDMIVVPGNSYGSRIFHIIRKTDDLGKYVPGIGNKSVNCAVVSPDGKVYQGSATKL